MPATGRIEADVAVVGAGGAGLFAALCAVEHRARVALVSATPLAETASYWAQGGLAAALAPDDSPEHHLRDTVTAGRGAVRPSAAEVLCREAPDRVRDLERLGVAFDTDRAGRILLGLEGGHSRRRVVHAGGSATGRRVVRQLSARVAEAPDIQVLERARATALLIADARCVGLACEDGRQVAARAVILATGGAAALWRRTTNPPGSLGVGLLLAHAAGAALADLELVQFHPTAVIGVPGREGFLITEAIRGEGATLHDSSGERFVDELAPRDEVARAIDRRLELTGARAVLLDMRAIDPARFPNVFSALADAGLDATREQVPVAPAVHYTMGGIVTDLQGCSTLTGLYAVGESGCTGLHGANRLASNSLSECFVFARRAAEAGLSDPSPPAGGAGATALEGSPLPTPETREAMWRHAGLRRTREGLAALAADRHPLARLIAAGALSRQETRGSHVRVDFPDADPALDRCHAVIPGGSAEPRFERWD
jgi:L-aspartate oxidase